jgi:hypothetical protein
VTRGLSILATLATLVSPIFFSAAFAETIAVRSGEHPDFTRLVLKLQPVSNWTLTKDSGIASLDIKADNIIFDVSTVFERIPRSRLRSVGQSEPGGPLLLELNCECRVEAFKSSGDLLVVDVSDVTDPVSPRLEPIRVRDRIYLAIPYSFSAEKRPPMPVAPEPKHHSEQGMEMGPAPELDRVGTSSLINRRENVNVSEQRLMEQLGRATTQGLLTLRRGGISKSGTIRATRRENNSFASGTLSDLEPSGISLHARSSMDREMEAILGMSGEPISTGTCLKTGQVTLKITDEDTSFASMIGFGRRALVPEFDNIEPSAARQLAYTYLYFGFGAEASQVLDLINTLGERDDVLRAIAQIFDGKRVASRNPFAGQTACDSDVALWALLTLEDDNTAMSVNAGAILTAFERLPSHLKTVVGPAISRQFLRVNAPEAAETALRILDRKPGEQGAGRLLAKADLAEIEENEGDADRYLQEVVNSGSEFSAEALVRFVDRHWHIDRAVDPALPDLIAAYASEYRSTDMALALGRAEVLARLLSGQFDEAFDLIKKLSGQGALEVSIFLKDASLARLTNDASDIVFLTYAFDLTAVTAEQLSTDTADALAERMLDMGFPSNAETLMMANIRSEASHRRKILRARAALDQGHPREAELQLLGATGSDADRLRARAREMLGDYQTALDLYSELDAKPAAARAAWLAGNWNSLSTEEGAIYGIGEVLKPDRLNAALPREIGTLGRSSSLLEGSAIVRAELGALMQRHQVLEKGSK